MQLFQFLFLRKSSNCLRVYDCLPVFPFPSIVSIIQLYRNTSRTKDHFIILIILWIAYSYPSNKFNKLVFPFTFSTSSSSKNREISFWPQGLSAISWHVRCILYYYSILSYYSSFTASSVQSDQSQEINDSYVQSFQSSSCFNSSSLQFKCSSFTSYLILSSFLISANILLLFNLSRKRSYHPLLKLNYYLPGILSSSMICLACLRICFRRMVGLFRIKLASLTSISGQSALRPPSFFLSYFVWYHLVIFLGWILSCLAFSLIILDRLILLPRISSLMEVISFFLNSIEQLLQVIDPFRLLGFLPSHLTSYLSSLRLSLSAYLMILISMRSSF